MRNLWNASIIVEVGVWDRNQYKTTNRKVTVTVGGDGVHLHVGQINRPQTQKPWEVINTNITLIYFYSDCDSL